MSPAQQRHAVCRRPAACGQSLVEYGLILALVAVVSMSGLSMLGGSISDQLSSLAGAIGGAAGGASSGGGGGAGAGGASTVAVLASSPSGGGSSGSLQAGDGLAIENVAPVRPIVPAAPQAGHADSLADVATVLPVITPSTPPAAAAPQPAPTVANNNNANNWSINSTSGEGCMGGASCLTDSGVTADYGI